MNSLVKSIRLSMIDLAGARSEVVIGQTEDEHKKLALVTTVNRDGSSTVMYLVYEGDFPIMQTPNIQDAMVKYNAIPIRPESVEQSGL